MRKSIFDKFKPTIETAFLGIFLRQIKLYNRNSYTILQVLVFFIISATVAKITSNTLDFNSLLIFLLFSLFLAADSLLITDNNNKILEQLLLIGVNFQIVIIAKLLAHLIMIGLPMVCCFVIVHYMLTSIMLNLTICSGLILAVCNIILIQLFTTSICIRSHTNGLATLLALPFTIPTMLFTSMMLENNDYALILFGLMLVLAPLFIKVSSVIVSNITHH